LIPIQIKSGFTRLPVDPSVPIILVGPGTGCAIFRSFLQHRQVLNKKGTSVGPAAFFFGCRHQQKDFLHDEDWKELVSQGVLSLFDPAFSRDQNHKIYVQHKIKQHSKEVWEYIQKGAFIYVSG
jgi:sulfite reductase alpha subunit-like flavoprotein